MNNKQYFLDTDGSCHWYLIDYSQKKEWDEWIDLDEEDPNAWEAPDFAKRIDGPQSIIFQKPIEIV